MPKAIRRLPAPSWSGVPDDVVQQFATFMATNMQRRNRIIPDQLAQEVRVTERALENARDELEYIERQINPLVRQERGLLKQLAARKKKTDVALQQQIDAIYALPFVLGSRVDAIGRLVVCIRPQLTQLGELRDGGDFDVTVAQPIERGVAYYPVSSARTVVDISDVLDYYNDDDGAGVEIGYIRGVDGGSDLITTWQFAKLIQMVHDRLVVEFGDEIDDDEPLPLSVGQPETAWDGFTANPVKALRRSLEHHDGTLEHSLVEVRGQLNENRARHEEAKRELRNCDAKARAARAALDRLRAQTGQEIVVQFESVVATIADIMRMPGVMGIRFSDNGIPVIHIRSTIEYARKRYDGGDFEIHFKDSPINRAQAGCKTKRTRGDRNRHYWHPEDYEHWFCYGDRSNEIQRLLDEGDYVAATNLVVNTLNAINTENQESIPRNYTQISNNLVWRSSVQIAPIEVAEAA